MTHFIRGARTLRPPLGPPRAREHTRAAHPAMKARRQPAVKNAFRHARVTTNARSGACGTGRSARRWHGGQIGAARTATQPHARFLILNLNSMVHSALNNMTNNLAHHQHFSSPSTSRAPLQVPCAAATCVPSASVNKIVALCAFLPNVDPSQLHDISFMLCNGYLPEVTERNPDFH